LDWYKRDYSPGVRVVVTIDVPDRAIVGGQMRFDGKEYEQEYIGRLYG